jgi:hypothetical protein
MLVPDFKQLDIPKAMCQVKLASSSGSKILFFYSKAKVFRETTTLVPYFYLIAENQFWDYGHPK